MIKLIASDMDGTLVNDDGKINEKVFNLIDTLMERGIKFTAASGRFYSQLKTNFQKVKGDMIIAAHNGALVKHSQSGKTLYSSPISKDNIQHVLSLTPEFKGDVFLAGSDKAYLVNPTDSILKILADYGVPGVIVNSFDEVTCPIYKVSYHVDGGVQPSMTQHIKDNISDSLEFVLSGESWLDVMNNGVSKGNAIKIIQDRFMIDEKNTMVFGDYYNDLAMFKVAYHSYAMENAPEGVKKHARFIAESNNDNGVYNIIHKYAVSL